MKNKYFQQKVASAKAYLKKHRSSDTRMNAQGVRIYHCYENPREISWWDDFGFVLGSQYVTVWWVHPRMKMQDKLSDVGYENTIAELGPLPPSNMFDKSIPITKKVGNGKRKKVVAYQMPETPIASSQWFDRWREESVKAVQTADISIRPSMSVQQYDWCRGVELCFPVELRNEQEITEFALKVRQHMRGEINLFEGLENYEYTTADFAREVPDYSGC